MCLQKIEKNLYETIKSNKKGVLQKPQCKIHHQK